MEKSSYPTEKESCHEVLSHGSTLPHSFVSTSCIGERLALYLALLVFQAPSRQSFYSHVQTSLFARRSEEAHNADESSNGLEPSNSLYLGTSLSQY